MQQFLPVPAALLMLGAALLAWHVKVWRYERDRDHEPAERDYFRRQFRRRIVGSSLLVTCSVLMAGGMLLSHKQWPAAFAASWLGAIVALLATIVAALFDMIANRGRFLRLQREQVVAKAIQKAQRNRVNGRPE